MTIAREFGGAAALQPRAETTAQQIKAYILRNHLRPGDLLPTEAELCETLGVSRSSVREAIRRLATLDIVEVRHGYGTFVGNLTLAPLVEGLVFRGTLSPGDEFRALREVVEVRISLDLAHADALAAVMAGTANPDLERLAAEMEEKAERGEPFLEADREFHSILASKLGNQLFEQLVTAFWEVHSVVAPALGVGSPEGLEDTARAHRAMLTAAEAGDADALRSAITAHFLPLQENMRRGAAS
jgi:DNA-binding FadR family transcriptional regulator